MEENERTLLAVINERVENLKLQMNRLISHFESEQRHSVRHGKDIDKLMHRIEMLENKLKERDATWKWAIPIGITILNMIYTYLRSK